MALARRFLCALSFPVCFVACGPWFSGVAQAQPPGGGPEASETPLVKKFDEDGDGRLNNQERTRARDYWEARIRTQPGRRRPGREVPGKPGPRIAPGDVAHYPDRPLYDPSIVRTLFLEFESADWEKELELFKPTDVEIPATLTVDGQEYPGVGASFRGASSFFRVPAGLKRSLNLSLDFVDGDQRLYGYKSLNLLNGSGDASLMSSFLYSAICGRRIPVPQVNYVRVVINGKSWGLYISSQQFNSTFVKEHFSTKKGARWKVPGSPRGDGGLRYLGEEIEPYRERFEIRSRDKEESWRALIHLCQVLNQTPSDKLEQALEPILDIDTALWFLAVDVALVNSDGYWTRASDYNLYRDTEGRFHILPHDMNEAFKTGRGRRGGPPGAGGPGRRSGQRKGPPPEQSKGPPPGNRNAGPPRGGGGPRGGFGEAGGPTLDPLTGLDEARKPLRSKLLKVPALQRRYLEYVREVAEMLRWENLGPEVEQVRQRIIQDVRDDTRKLSSLEAFLAATSAEKPAKTSSSLRAFAEQRSAFLLNHPRIQALPEK